VGALSQGVVAFFILLYAEQAGDEKPKKNHTKKKHARNNKKARW